MRWVHSAKQCTNKARLTRRQALARGFLQNLCSMHSCQYLVGTAVQPCRGQIVLQKTRKGRAPLEKQRELSLEGAGSGNGVLIVIPTSQRAFPSLSSLLYPQLSSLFYAGGARAADRRARNSAFVLRGAPTEKHHRHATGSLEALTSM